MANSHAGQAARSPIAVSLLSSAVTKSSAMASHDHVERADNSTLSSIRTQVVVRRSKRQEMQAAKLMWILTGHAEGLYESASRQG